MQSAFKYTPSEPESAQWGAWYPYSERVRVRGPPDQASGQPQDDVILLRDEYPNRQTGLEPKSRVLGFRSTFFPARNFPRGKGRWDHRTLKLIWSLLPWCSQLQLKPGHPVVHQAGVVATVWTSQPCHAVSLGSRICTPNSTSGIHSCNVEIGNLNGDMPGGRHRVEITATRMAFALSQHEQVKWPTVMACR